MNRSLWIMLGVMALLVGAVAAACSSDTDDLEARIEALETGQAPNGEISALHDMIVQANMVATLHLLDGVGFHELNQGIREGGEAPAGTNGRIRTAWRAVAVTNWADDLEPGAQDLQQKLQAFFDALRGDDVAAKASTSQAAHDAYHEFTGKAWDFLAASAGLGPGGAQEGHEGMDTDGGADMNMDGATGTPAGGMDQDGQ